MGGWVGGRDVWVGWGGGRWVREGEPPIGSEEAELIITKITTTSEIE